MTQDRRVAGVGTRVESVVDARFRVDGHSY
jgi:hypothetical protein